MFKGEKMKRINACIAALGLGLLGMAQAQNTLNLYSARHYPTDEALYSDFTKATGLTLDLTARGMGLRSNRYSMLVKDGKVATLNIEGPGKFEVSDADTMLSQAKA